MSKLTISNPDRELNIIVIPDKTLQPEWSVSEYPISYDSSTLQQEIYKRFNEDIDAGFLYLAFCSRDIPLSASMNFWRDFAGLYARDLVKTPELESLRHKTFIPLQTGEIEEALSRAPMMTGAEYLSAEILNNIWEGLNRTFQRQIKAYSGTVEDFIKTYSPSVHLAGRVYFHLVENKNDQYPFAFLATYTTKVNKQGQSTHLPLKQALQELKGDDQKLLKLLSTVTVAARDSSFVSGLLESGELFQPISLTSLEAYQFLKEVPIYERSGILCRIPNWWKGARSGFKVKIIVGNEGPSQVGMDALVNFNISLYLDEGEVRPEEARRLLETAEGLVFIKNKWVVVDHDKLQETLKVYEKAQSMYGGSGITLLEAMRMQMNPQRALGVFDDVDIDTKNGKWLDSVMEKMANPLLIKDMPVPKEFAGILRHYQETGLRWLMQLNTLRFGICLADDMGLGKTIQILALLSAMKPHKPHAASLLIVPVSLISNWQQEIQRFTPELSYHIAHPDANKERDSKELSIKDISNIDLVITSYSMAQKYEWIKDYQWRCLILDEAQAIKNPSAKQTKSVKALKALNRIAITGTPVENSLSDLWSIFDFINPGLLGSPKEFSDFAKYLKDKPEGYSRLRKVVSPYILRRLKTDKSVIKDLPEKIEMKTYASLSKKQALLYKGLVDKLRHTLEHSEGIQRKGIILSSLMKFKQLCNHPDHYTGSGDFLEDDSGKFQRLREICQTIHEKREKVLVFTQFREMTHPLRAFLSGVFGRDGLSLDGSTALGKRKEIVRDFQESALTPFLVLSIKAGGVGLNLTAANHVIIFDRWWNPAVENQAADRAFRIGQKKNVVVHKFLTKGTIEEKIDNIIESKTSLFNEVIQKSPDESWLTEMKNEEILELFSLSI